MCNARNEVIFGGKVINPLQISNYAMSLQAKKATNTTSFEIQNYISFKANGSVIIICDAAYFEKKGR